MASLADLRDALTALGISTSTGQLRGDERRQVLQQRLNDAQKQLGLAPKEAQTLAAKPLLLEKQPSQDGSSSFQTMTLSELRAELDDRNLPTQTPGLKGEARRHALLQRLLNAGEVPAREKTSSVAWEAASDEAASSRSSTSSYSAVGEFLFFDLSSGKRFQPAETSAPKVPPLTLLTSPLKLQFDLAKAERDQPKLKNSAAAAHLRENLERELIDLRRQLHAQRTSRSLSRAKSLKDAGFQRGLGALSTAMQKLETERQRILCVAFAHELVTTTATMNGFAVELVQEDAVRLIEKQQEHLRHQIQLTKHAMAIVKQQQAANQADHDNEAEIQTTIRRIQLQLQLYYPNTQSSDIAGDQDSARSSNSIASTSSTVSSLSPDEAPVLMRCRSMPSSSFHEAWRELDDSQRQQLHKELKAAKSFRIRQDRVCVGDENPKSLTARPTTSGRQSILAFTRYPPTPADKLGIKALFLEQSHRSVVEILRTYQQALALEPHHAIILGNYACCLDQKCSQIDQADQVFKQALLADPLCMTNVAAYARFLHHRRRDLTKAEELYIQVLRSTPREAVVLGNYASLLHKQANRAAGGSASQLMQAKQFLLQATEIDGTQVSNRLRLCSIHEELHEVTEAQRCYERLVEDIQQWQPHQNNQETEPTPRLAERIALWAHAYGNFANFLKRNGQLKRAKRMYKTALDLQPDDTLLQRNFSVFLRDFHKEHKVSAQAGIALPTRRIVQASNK